MAMIMLLGRILKDKLKIIIANLLRKKIRAKLRKSRKATICQKLRNIYFNIIIRNLKDWKETIRKNHKNLK
jgi:hypothetical protein